MRLIDAHGEEGFSMRRLARALGVDPMAIYHHLPNKAAVLHEAIEAVVAACALPAPEGSWQRRVRAVCHAYRALARAHPGVFPVICAHQTPVPSDYRIVEALLAALSEAGLSAQDTVRAAWMFLYYAAGFALDELTSTLRPFSHEEQADLRALPKTKCPARVRLLDAVPRRRSRRRVHVRPRRHVGRDRGAGVGLSGITSPYRCAAGATGPAAPPP